MKKHIFKRIFALVTTSVLALGVCGCGGTDNDKNHSGSDRTDGNSYNVVYNDNHIFKYEKTNKWLLYQGKTKYKICIPDDASQEIKIARDELVRIFAEATGCTLSVVSDSGKTHDEEACYISLGNNELYASSGLNVDQSQLKRDGSRIITKDRTIYIVGGQDIGVLYGVYDLLNLWFGFETYYSDCYDLEKGVENLALWDFDVTDIPDIDYRQKNGIMFATGSDIDDAMYSYRLRSQDGYGNMLLPIHLGDSRYNEWKVDHNCFWYFPKDEYMATYPEFYASSGEQMCFTAKGDAELFDLMTTIAAEKIEQSLVWYPAAEYPNYIGVQLGMNDLEGQACTCDACTREKNEHNGALSATLIKFLNATGKKVNAWMELPENAAYKRENFQYMFLAYNDEMSVPPVEKDAKGNYIVKEDLKEEGVIIVPYCALNRFDFGKSLYDPVNSEVYENGKAWSAAFPNVWSWSYGGFFNDYISFYDYFNFYADFYAYLYENDFAFSFPQIHDWQRGADTGFTALAYYVCSKLAWNSALRIDDLIDDYFAAMYKEAAKPMRQFFDSCRLWFARQSIEEGWGTTAIQLRVSEDRKYWSVGLLNGWMQLLDEAYEAISVYKEGTKEYQSLKEHIDFEWLAPAKVIISNFENSYKETEYNAIKMKFKTICKDLGVMYIREWVTIDGFLESL